MTLTCMTLTRTQRRRLIMAITLIHRELKVSIAQCMQTWRACILVCGGSGTEVQLEDLWLSVCYMIGNKSAQKEDAC